MLKRKKWMCLGAAAVATLLLCACAGEPTPAPPEMEEFRLVRNDALEPFDAAETEKMINIMCRSRALILEGRLYCFDFDSEYRPVLAAYDILDDSLGEQEILAENCRPEDLAELDGRVYYVNSGALESIKTDGSGRKTLREGSCSFFQIHEGQLYYCDEAGRFCTARADGKGETILINDRCFYPWLTPKAVIYQSYSDLERLHLYWREDGTYTPLSPGAGYAPIAVGDRLYYTSREGLASVSLDGTDLRETVLPELVSAVELLPEGEAYRLRWVADVNGLRQRGAALDTLGDAETGDAAGYRMCDYVGGGYRVDACYNPDGRIRCFALVFPDGHEVEYIAGNTN